MKPYQFIYWPVIQFFFLGKVLGFAKKALGTVAGPLVSGGLSLIGGERRNEAQVASAREQMQFQQASTREQMDFQERMSNTAHQREIKDLQKAGLNPILSARYGGATTPPGSHAQGAMPHIEDTISPAVATALQTRRLGAEVRHLEAQADKEQAEAQVARANVPKIHQETENLGSMNDFIKANTKYHIGLDRKTMFDIVKIRNESLNLIKEFDVKVATEKQVLQRVKNLKQQYNLTQQNLRMLLTRFPGLLIEQRIDESTYGEVIRWLGRLNPFGSSARDFSQAVVPFKPK